MRLRQIEVFYHVYGQGSISGAARELNVSQPSVSKVLRYAEDQLGFALFRREKGRLFATQAADELYVDIKDIYERISAFDRTAQNIKKRKGGHVRFGVLPSLSLDVIPQCISQMRQSNPDVSFEVTTLHSSEMNLSLIEKRCDICIGYGSPVDDRLIEHKLGETELVLAVPATHSQISGDYVDLSILHGIDFIGLQDSGPAGAALSNALNDEGIVPHEIVTAHTYHVALALVKKGVGLSVVDQYTANNGADDELKYWQFKNPLSVPVCATSLCNNGQSELISDCLSALQLIVEA